MLISAIDMLACVGKRYHVMMLNVSLGDLQIAYRDSGQGQPLVAAHCSCASSREWHFLNSALGMHYRILAPDLLGYGHSAEWPPGGKTLSISDVDVLEAMLTHCHEPVHLIGHSYGAAICLELACRYARTDPKRIRSLFLVEPVAFYLLREFGYKTEWEEISRIGRQCIAACEKGNSERAANIFMGYWLGTLKWRLSPGHLKAEVIRTMPKVAYEFRGMFEFAPDIERYREIACPVSLLAGGKSRRTALAVIAVLTRLLPSARTVTIPAAGHMSPFTHKHDILAQLQNHLAG